MKTNKIRTTFQRINTLVEKYSQDTLSKTKLGRPYIYSPSWMISLIILQRILGFRQETSFLKQIPMILNIPADQVPTQGTYNKRVHKFALEESDFLNWLRDMQPWWAYTTHLLIDAFPAEAKHYARRFTKKKCSWASVGYCASKQQYYFGYKILLLCTRKGFPVQWLILPARHHEVKWTSSLLLSHENKFVIGDKGFTSAKLFEHLLMEQSTHLFYPPKENSRESELTVLGKKWMGDRKQVENFISILERMGLNRPGGKSDTGNMARIISGICAIGLMQVLKIRYKENLDLQGIMMN